MIEADQLFLNRPGKGSRIWEARQGDSILGEMIFQPSAALIPMEVSNAANTSKCAVALFESGRMEPSSRTSRLWLAGKFSGGCTEVLDAGGRAIGGWQGEWLRVLNHPAGRVILKDSFHWEWINPAGLALAAWEILEPNFWRIDFRGLESNQAYCRLVALLKAGETISQVSGSPQ